MRHPGILVIDDQESILQNFATLLDPPDQSGVASELDELELALGGEATPVEPAQKFQYEMKYARQGLDGLRECRAAKQAGAPFSVAFVDIHMPPGIDGVETARELWKLQPDLEIVLCTAHSMYSWQEILEHLPKREQLVILRKPFDPIEVRQLAACLTEKWRRGRAIEQQMQELEQKVAQEVTRRLELELGALQKFEALGRLTAGIAHEISTPLQCAQSSFEFLEDVLTTSDVDVRGAIADGLEGMRRASAIVRSVSEYSYHRPGPGPVDLNRQVHMAAQLARTEYRHDADLVLDLGELPPLQGFADELGRAILNLLVNASHAIAAKRRPEERGKITISTRSVAEGVRLSISDTGTGISPEHRARIFEPFFTTKSLGKGTGQGLAMVHTTVVEHHQGAIEVDSTPGQGTTFHLQLPLSIQERAA